MSSQLDFTTFFNIIGDENRAGSRVAHGINPSDGSALWDSPLATEQDLNDAVAAAQRAFPKWAATPWSERAAAMKKAAARLREHRKQMTNILVLEVGKPLGNATNEVLHAAEQLDYFASQPEIPETIIQDDDEITLKLRHGPLGIVGAICPWNFPMILAMTKIASALITGNCIIVKPSPYTPYSIIKFIELGQPFFPPGVLQGLTGDDSLGPLICEHPGISKISFTGSSPTGRKVMASASKSLKEVTLELGGNSGCIVCPDVDIKTVAPQVAMGAFYNSGQVCIASKRIYVHESIYDKFKEALTNFVKSWKIGPASLEGVNMGPVQNKAQFDIIKGFFDDTKRNGYKFALGGDIDESQNGYLINPAIVDRPPDSSKIVSEEPFGKVNDTNTGLGGSVWSADLERAERLARGIEAGTAWINHFERPLPQAYFSGHKQSGVGGEGGQHGLLAYTKAQCLHVYKARSRLSKL
ncbi:aldehyde dehydrogenase [Ilyonectria sp. MPI-CAGE-AT-0026]|nr:aldehyde dehydrogenase [Ilyonectria sp. MPI-CAGE-AT-0026]